MRRPAFLVKPRRDRLIHLLAAVFAFNLGAAAWSAVVAGRMAQQGEGSAMLGSLYALCELARLPGAILLPAAALKFGPRRVAQAGLVALVALPFVAVWGLGSSTAALTLVLSALPSMAVYAGLPALVLAAAGTGRDGLALAWLGLAGGAGGALGPWLGGSVADTWGMLPVLGLFGLGSALLFVPTSLGPLPVPTPWNGWRTLLHKGLPWQALAALALASAADAGRAALVPSELIGRGLALSDVGLLLGLASSVAGVGFLFFGRMADRRPAVQVLGVGLLVLVLGSFSSAVSTSWSPAFALAAAVLGIGASGMRLGAEIRLIGWLGRDRAGVASALGETTVLGGRAFGAPAVGALGASQGDAAAFGAIGLVGLLAIAPLAFTFFRTRRLQPQPVTA